MNDRVDTGWIQRDIGALQARLEEHEKRFDRIEDAISKGFASVGAKLDALTEVENRRRGALGLLKGAARVLFSGGVFTALFEAVRTFLTGGGHHR